MEPINSCGCLALGAPQDLPPTAFDPTPYKSSARPVEWIDAAMVGDTSNRVLKFDHPPVHLLRLLAQDICFVRGVAVCPQAYVL